MAFIFTCGTHEFQSLLSPYENITVQCQRCGNYSGKVVKIWEWFTFCFVPIIPFSLKPWHAVFCHICKTRQEVKHRPDVQQQMQQVDSGGQIPMHNQQSGPPQGWQGQHPQYPPPAQQQQYGQQGGQPVYK